MLNSNVIETILNEYKEKIKKEEKRVSTLLNNLINNCPDLKTARQEYSSSRVKSTVARLSGEKVDFSLSKKNYDLELKKACKSQGVSVDDLNIKFNCGICKDTGYVGLIEKRYCNCLINESSKLIIKSQNLNSNYTFEKFDVNIFPNDKVVDKAGRTQREHIHDVKQRIEKWCDNFPITNKIQMLITGKTGVGKSFLVNCIAHRLIERGYSVVNTTSSAINEAMFSVINNKDYSLVNLFKHCDLLILDDLGVEPLLNNITSETLYEILEHRITKNKHTIVSTNLDISGIRGLYGTRISSRLTSARNTGRLEILGDDLREM